MEESNNAGDGLQDALKDFGHYVSGIDSSGNLVGMKTVESEDKIQIIRKWPCGILTILGVALIMLCLGAIIVWIAHSVLSGQTPLDAKAVFVLSLLTGIWLFLLYKTVADYLNTTYITVDAEYIKVRQGPLRWPGNRSVPTKEITQLEVFNPASKSGNFEGFELQYHTKSSGWTRTLGTAMGRPQAEYTKQNIERFLQTLS